MTRTSSAPLIHRPTGLRAERKRRAIVAAAREIFVKNGYDAGIDVIAEAAGVSKVTIYNHFGSKEQLFTEVIGEAFGQALGGAGEQALSSLAGADDLRQALTAAARGWVAGITRPEMTDLRLLVIRMARRFPELARKWLEQSPQRFAPVIAGALRELSRRGDLAVPDPDLAVIQFYALTVYPHIVRSTFGIQLDAHATEELLTSGVDMFLSYYTAKDPAGAANAEPPPGGPGTDGAAMTHTTDPRVDAYIDALPDWQQAICREVRALVHAADKEVTETIKRTNRPYFVLEGNICALLAAKDHVNVFLYDGAIVPDPEGIITGGHGNKAARTVAIRQGETINAPALTAMFRHIIANNRAGGWRKLKQEADPR
jgi:AcrR family transcriptional regulator